ncbi:L-lactate dehydrogenase complex protein LldG [Kineococcus xinjiangensis]|uniref:L-lactate dehydrogenase complex protein LldG n=1 Tax=Kineococcus xinjiangensis TaxID=512762 RepID=A0A2S6IH27_9ACTN|nr:LUD domain-containing protein [Kineococcus xinjiangensis]PPK93460.1 L-lactate dehydrogenase complex protein LldG [Kineococcus xinjiangensis]
MSSTDPQDAGGGSTARDEVLATIRAALEATKGHEPGQAPREYRSTGEHAPGSEAVLELFVERVEDYKATVLRCDPDAIPETVSDVLAQWGASHVVVPPDFGVEWLSSGQVRITTDDGSLTPEDVDAVDAVLTGCAVGIAETGTVVLDGSGDQGRRMISLVPDRHLVLVHADQVVQTVPEAVARLDGTRPLTWISGPSATSDIELDRVEGVHGPRTLAVVLVG